ncbi:MAG: AAA family ATPase [Acidobacteria bacterium]|nr:AAA family ATPase [Acidobacteriota bacterium]
MLAQVQVQNLLSFGPKTTPLELSGLTVLIGPNGSGKSNFIEALALVRATPIRSRHSANNVDAVIRRGGGSQEWIWKGRDAGIASLSLRLAPSWMGLNIHHRLSYELATHYLRLVTEEIDAIDLWQRYPSRRLEYKNNGAGPPILRANESSEWKEMSGINREDSILAQVRDADTYTVFTAMEDTYQSIRIYRDWAFGRSSILRAPQPADIRNNELEEDFSNLGLFLSRLGKNPKAKAKLLSALKDLYDGILDYQVVVEGGTVQVFFTEGEFSIPATRLSDGTLRYLCLLAILCDPEPPPLICIEEPELGLHPDILPKLADLLVEASERTQLIVTTHSDVLVDAMTERPECVVVCEKHEGSTVMKRLNRDDLSQWLEKYRLGQLWLSGQIGGTRW